MGYYTNVFDKLNEHWRDNREFNVYFLKERMRYIQALFDARGYIYLNQLYEAFGLRWCPEYDNPVLTKDSRRVLNVNFTVVEHTNDVVIEIEW